MHYVSNLIRLFYRYRLRSCGDAGFVYCLRYGGKSGAFHRQSRAGLAIRRRVFHGHWHLGDALYRHAVDEHGDGHELQRRTDGLLRRHRGLCINICAVAGLQQCRSALIASGGGGTDPRQWRGGDALHRHGGADVLARHRLEMGLGRAFSRDRPGRLWCSAVAGV